MRATRRGFLIGLTGLIAAPAIVRVSSLMPVRVLPVALTDMELWRRSVMRRVQDGAAEPIAGWRDAALRELAARQPVEDWTQEPVMLHAEPGYVRAIDPGQPPRPLYTDGECPGEAYGWDWVANIDYSGAHSTSVTPITAMRMVS